MSLPREAQEFLISLVGKSPNTKRLYQHVLSEFIKYHGNLKTLTAADTIQYLSNLEKRGLSKNTLRITVIVLKSWLKTIGRNDIAETIRPIREAKTPPVALPEDNISRMIAAADNPRDTLIVLALRNSGIRVSELLNIQVQDIDFKEGVIRVFGKGGKTRLVLIDSKTLQAITNYLQDRTSGPIFNISPNYVRTIIKDLAKKAGLENWQKIHPHLLRHAFAINWVKSGGDVEGLRRLLGHESLETTRIYLDFDFGHVKDTYRKITERSDKATKAQSMEETNQ